MTPSQLSVHFFLQIAVILVTCRVVGRLARRIGQPQVVGEMIAGVLLGPSLFGALAPAVQQALFPPQTLGVLYVGAQLGVGLYMFLVGTTFAAEHFRERARSAVAVSVSGIAVPFALAFALAPWLQHVPGLFAARARLLRRAPGCPRCRCSSAPPSRSPPSRCWRASSTSAAWPAPRWARSP